MTFFEFADKYCQRQKQTPEGLLTILQQQRERYRPVGWFMLEAVDMCSSRFGDLVILPYGPNNTYKAVPDHPVSPRGLASDMSVVVAVLPADELPQAVTPGGPGTSAGGRDRDPHRV